MLLTALKKPVACLFARLICKTHIKARVTNITPRAYGEFVSNLLPSNLNSYTNSNNIFFHKSSCYVNIF